MKTVKLGLTTLVFCVGIFAAYAQQSGEMMFKTFCSACHTISKGRLIGPDLADVQLRRSDDWLAEFIKSSQAMVSKGDPDAVALFEEYNKTVMPDAPYSIDQIKEIIGYIKSKSPGFVATTESTTSSIPEEPKQPVRSVNEATESEIKLGQLLFTGETKLGEGGPGCISCHHVKNNALIGGGLLAKDLTDAFSRMNEAGIQAILTSPPFPAMREAYLNHPVSEQEAYALTAFLKQADEDQFGQYPRNWQHFFLLSGGASFIALLVIFSMVWSNRKKNAVNKKIFDRQVYS
ncbi:MAG: c-type cytochrome [Cyclobacteriaceae bacterium]|jgi:cytochrome c2|nr:MAG: c-type cytochrome [Cyclobacteriaceae bacterium]